MLLVVLVLLTSHLQQASALYHTSSELLHWFSHSAGKRPDILRCACSWATFAIRPWPQAVAFSCPARLFSAHRLPQVTTSACTVTCTYCFDQHFIDHGECVHLSHRLDSTPQVTFVVRACALLPARPALVCCCPSGSGSCMNVKPALSYQWPRYQRASAVSASLQWASSILRCISSCKAHWSPLHWAGCTT